jgi:hypothetical protein
MGLEGYEWLKSSPVSDKDKHVTLLVFKKYKNG